MFSFAVDDSEDKTNNSLEIAYRWSLELEEKGKLISQSITLAHNEVEPLGELYHRSADKKEDIFHDSHVCVCQHSEHLSGQLL